MNILDIQYPLELDSDINLFLVRDELRCTLRDDYNPGDTRIAIYDEYQKIDKFPPTGIITLTEQLSDIDKRAITFFYDNRVEDWNGETFENLIKFPEFDDYIKPKDITHVTLNVVASHHNNLKDALIEVQKAMGIRDTLVRTTLAGRIKYLEGIVLTPRAWFTSNTTVGRAPFAVRFINQSFRLGNNPQFTWYRKNALDPHDPFVEMISITPSPDNKDIEYEFTEPGKWDIRLVVENEHGQDEVVFPGYITSKLGAPIEATLQFQDGTPIVEGMLRRYSVNQSIRIEVPTGDDGTHSYAGELLDPLTMDPVDPVTSYTWDMSDNVDHANDRRVTALYNKGGIYDVVLRVDTLLDAYRITTVADVLDVMESTNLWLWNYNDPNTASEDWDLQILGHGSTSAVTAYEFGLSNQTFKTMSTSLSIVRDDSFLDGTNNEKQAKKEFRRNSSFAQRGTTSSGSSGHAMLYWASGGDYNDQTIEMSRYNGFSDVYSAPPNMPTSVERRHPWNWICLSSTANSYFLFGSRPDSPSGENLSEQTVKRYNFSTGNITSFVLDTDSYLDGAEELQHHPSIYAGSSDPTPTPTPTPIFTEPENGYFACYRTTWKGNSGYIVRNSSVGAYFRYENFYRTIGTTMQPVEQIEKLTDMPGTPKLEGQLVSLSNGLFFFNNSSEVVAYNDSNDTWEVGGPSQASIAFNSLQDTSVPNYNSDENTLLAFGRLYNAYLSYDYSANTFIRFHSTLSTFYSVGSRPTGHQFLLGIF